jgi:hypothetical protein
VEAAVYYSPVPKLYAGSCHGQYFATEMKKINVNKEIKKGKKQYRDASIWSKIKRRRHKRNRQ